jgi:hypothetical protein
MISYTQKWEMTIIKMKICTNFCNPEIVFLFIEILSRHLSMRSAANALARGWKAPHHRGCRSLLPFFASLSKERVPLSLFLPIHPSTPPRPGRRAQWKHSTAELHGSCAASSAPSRPPSPVTPAVSPLMDPAPPARKSSLEILLDTLRERDEQRGEHFLPPSPARPRGRGRPPTSVRWALPAGFKVGNGEVAVSDTVLVDKKSDAGKEGATISDDGNAGVARLVIETVLGDAMSPDPEEEQCIHAKSRSVAADPTLSPHGMDELIQEDEDDTVMCINHGCTGIVDGANRQVPESEVSQIIASAH